MASSGGRQWWSGSAVTAVVALISWSVAVYWATARAVGSDDGPPEMVIVVALLAIVGIPLHIVLHELGHLLAALAMRLRVTEVALWASPGTRVRTIARTRIRIGFRGQTHVRLSAPPELTAVRARAVAAVAAGPLTNIVTAFACWIAGESAANGLVRALWFALAAGAAVLGVANAVPANAPKAAGGKTDGLLIVRWLTRPEGLRTGLTLEYLEWRGRDPGNRWRRFEDLQSAPSGASSLDDAR